MRTACLNLVMMNSHQLSKNLPAAFQCIPVGRAWNFKLSLSHPATRQQSQTTGDVESWLERFTKHGQSRCYLQSPCCAYSSVYMECSVINMVFPHIITSNMCLPVTNALCLVHPTVPLLGFGTTASHSETTRAYNNYEYKIYQNITSIDCK